MGKKAGLGGEGSKVNCWMFHTLCRKSVFLEYPKICFILLLYGVVSVCTNILLQLTTLTTCKRLFAVNLKHSVSYVTFKKSTFLLLSPDVLQGVYRGQKVAVKSLLDDIHAAQSFLAEASIMTYVWISQ